MTKRAGFVLTMTVMTVMAGMACLTACEQSSSPAGGVVSPVVGPVDQTPPPPKPATPESATTAPPDDGVQAGPPLVDPVDEAARLERARALVNEMARAYQAAPTMVDHVTFTNTMGGRETTPGDFHITVGHGRDISIITRSNDIVAVDGFVNVSVPRIADKYLRVPLDGDMLTTMTNEFGSYRGVMFHASLRYGKTWEEVLYTLSLGLPGPTRLANHRTITDLEGRTLEQITIISGAGTTTLHVDPETKLMVNAEVEYVPPESPIPNFRIHRFFEFTPVVYDELPEPIVFDPAGRTPVTNALTLMGQFSRGQAVRLAVAEGEVVPDFKLHNIDGAQVGLADHRGSVVIVSFWSNTNPGSKAGMKHLQRVANWAAESGASVTVLPIVTMGAGEKPGQRWEKAFDFFEQQAFTMTCLVDDDDTVANALGVPGVPMTVVIDAEGRLVKTVPRFDNNLLEQLRPWINQALGQ